MGSYRDIFTEVYKVLLEAICPHDVTLHPPLFSLFWVPGQLYFFILFISDFVYLVYFMQVFVYEIWELQIRENAEFIFLRLPYSPVSLQLHPFSCRQCDFVLPCG